MPSSSLMILLSSSSQLTPVSWQKTYENPRGSQKSSARRPGCCSRSCSTQLAHILLRLTWYACWYTGGAPNCVCRGRKPEGGEGPREGGRGGTGARSAERRRGGRSSEDDEDGGQGPRAGAAAERGGLSFKGDAEGAAAARKTGSPPSRYGTPPLAQSQLEVWRFLQARRVVLPSS